MPLERLTLEQALARAPGFDAVIDARSPLEFAEDHLPGAVNWPVLDDEQRRLIGTRYKQISAFEARKAGAVVVARNIAAHLEREGPGLTRTWSPLVYCWRGGQRSGSLALVLSQVGFAVSVLEGGYKAFRRHVVQSLGVAPPGLRLRMVCGRTGTGKSRLLGELSALGAQVLDLEAIACHRGSVLGALPQTPQPSQKRFETALWHALGRLDPAREVFVESESRTIGRLRLPEPLLQCMRSAPCLRLEMPQAARVRLLMQDYGHLIQTPQALAERLDSLREARGHALVDAWQALLARGDFPALVAALLEQHYDPIYLRSMSRNFNGFDGARVLPIADESTDSLRATARLAIAAT